MFQKMTKDWNFDLFGGPKWPKNLAPDAHILHTYKNTCSDFSAHAPTPQQLVRALLKYRNFCENRTMDIAGLFTEHF